MKGSMEKIFTHIKKGIREILPSFIFFFIMFHLLLATRALTLKEFGITTHMSLTALIGALVVAKAIFISDRFPFLNLYPKKPLIWNVICKTIMYGLITLLFLIVEEMVHQSRRYGSFSIGYERMGTDIVWPVFWAREIWVTVFLIFYSAAVEVSRVIGIEKVKSMLFKKSKGEGL